MARNKTAKAGAGKFLALLASLTMIIAGLIGVGIAAAAPANAGQVFDGNITECPAPYTTVGLTLSDGWASSDSASWTSAVPVSRIYVKAGNYYTYDDIAPATSGTLNTDAIDEVKPGDSANISHAFGCAMPAPPEPGMVDGGSAEYCVDGKDVTVEWAGESYGGDTGRTETDAEGIVEQNKSDAYEEAGISEDAEQGTCLPAPKFTADITCSTWSASIDGFVVQQDQSDDRVVLSKESGYVEVFIDGELVSDGYLDDNGDFSDSGVINPAFTDGKTHTLTVEVDGDEVDSATSGVCAAPPKTCQELNNCPTPPPTDPGCTTCKTEVPPVVTPPVEPAVVAPIIAPAAATVAAPAPAKVAVPAAATLPGSVPAGDGSQAPGLPMWALAMVAVGVLGAGFAGKQILAARK
jgi:hypothetical protein